MSTPSRCHRHFRLAKPIVPALSGALAFAAAAAAQPCDPEAIFDGFIPMLGPVSLSPQQQVAIADLDGDGDGDIFMRQRNPPEMWIYRNQGDGHFQDQYRVPLGFTINQPGPFVVADFDGDGLGDLVAGNLFGAGLTLQLNESGVNFQPVVSIPSNGATEHIISGDFDGDGTMDFATAGPTGLELFYNDGSGTFSREHYFPAAHLFRLAAGDLDGDGRLDIVASRRNGGVGVVVYRNIGGGQVPVFAAQFVAEPNAGGGGIDLGDFDGDGLLDIAVSGSTLNAYVIRQVGPLQFAPSVPFFSGADDDLFARDVDGDGDLDLLHHEGFTGLQILINDGNGMFAEPVSVPVMSTDLTQHDLAVGDLDGDGGVDVVVAVRFGPSVIAFNTCAGMPTFAPQPSSVVVDAGDTIELGVGVEPAVGAIQYQWRRAGVDLVDGGRISGATTAVLSIASATIADSDVYDVVVSNGVVQPILSEPAFVLVRGPDGGASCPADVDGNSVVDFQDLLEVLGRFGEACG